VQMALLDMEHIDHLMDDGVRRALRRERVFRDRGNPLDVLDDLQLYEQLSRAQKDLAVWQLKVAKLQFVTLRQNMTPAEVYEAEHLEAANEDSFVNLDL
uniref:Uncharacterized protein n=1 Tax=Plectus sambesii TaxID=2011161 RepID=A0A914UWZ9_9BILA